MWRWASETIARSQIFGHDLDAVGLDGAGEDLDAVGAIADLLIDASSGFGDGVDLGHLEARVDEVLLDVDGSFDPERFANREDARALERAGVDLVPDEIGVGER